MSLNTKKLQSYTVYYSERTQTKSTVRRSPKDLCFDSLGEFELWLWLKKALPHYINIKVHNKVESIAGIDWKIDYELSTVHDKGKNFLTLLGNALNPLPDKDLDSTDILWIEFKGILDDNYLGKQKLITQKDKWLDSRLIVVSKVPTAYIIEDLTLYQSLIKVVHSTDMLKGKVKQCLQKL